MDKQKSVELRPLKGEEVVLRVPKGTADHVRIVEFDENEGLQGITVQVSRERKLSSSPAVGVIVK